MRYNYPVNRYVYPFLYHLYSFNHLHITSLFTAPCLFAYLGPLMSKDYALIGFLYANGYNGLYITVNVGSLLACGLTVFA